MSPWQLLTNAYHHTMSHPKLWWLGLFLGSTFTLPWLIVLGTRLSPVFRFQLELDNTFARFGLFRGLWMVVILGVLVLLITSVAKVALILRLARSRRFPGFGETDPHHKRLQIKQYIGRVAAVAVVTAVVMGTGLFILTTPFLKSADTVSAEVSILGSLFVLLLCLTFVVSILGVFSCFGVVLLQLSVAKSFKLAADMLKARWQEVVSAVSAIAVVYAFAAMAGVATLSFLDAGVKLVIHAPQLGVAQSFAMIQVLSWLERMLLWGWFAVLNIFVYTALYLLFSHIVQDGLKKSEPAPKQSVLQVELS